jgi:aryl-alcohol dehydrogenase-like predicted oxidoreductase
MEVRNIKGTGLAVSRLCLGTMTFGGQTAEPEALRIIDAAVDAGVNFFDTANIYTGGESERILGKAIQGRRERLVIATKAGGPTYQGPNGAGLGRVSILRSLDESLKRLDTDYVDLYYLHFPDPNTPAAEMVETMTSLVRSGKVRYWGVSNFAAWQLCELVHLARETGGVAPVVTQSVYNPLTRGVEDELFPFLRAYSMGMTVFNPLAGGLLTGKHSRDKAAEGSRMANDRGYALRYWNARNFDAIDVLTAAAKDLGVSLVELCFRWHLGNPCVDAVISGVSSLAQFEENAGYFDAAPLPAETLAECDRVWKLIRGDWFNYHR